MSNELIIPEKLNAVELFKSDEAVEDILGKIEKEAKSIIPDISTEQGRKEIASIAYKVARTKTALDNLGKDLTETARQQINAVNKGRKEIRDRLDELRDDVRKPLTEFEEKEKARKQEHENRLQGMVNQNDFENFLAPDSKELAEAMCTLKLLYTTAFDDSPYEWEEFKQRADDTYKDILSALLAKHEAAIKSEEQAAELEKLRKEKEEHEAQEERQRIADEAAAIAKKEAEEKATREAEVAANKARAKNERIQREKDEAEQKLKDAELARVAAEKKAEADKKDAEEKAQRDADAAAKAERARIEAEQQKAADAEAKREANKKHNKKINNQSMNDLIDYAGLTEAQAKQAVIAISKGTIRNIKINY